MADYAGESCEAWAWTGPLKPIRTDVLLRSCIRLSGFSVIRGLCALSYIVYKLEIIVVDTL